MRRIARSEYPEAYTSADVEFTNWESVDAFAEEFDAFVNEQAGRGTTSN